MSKYYLKLTSYLLSLLPLGVLFSIKAYSKMLQLKTDDRLFRLLIIGALIYFIMISIWIGIWYAKKRWSKFPVMVTSVRNNNTEQILYLMTYMIPLISIDYDRITLLQLIASLIFMGFIYCKTNLFFANPFLSLLWWNVYRAHIENTQINEDAIIMTRKKLRDISSQSHNWLYVVDEEIILIV